MMPSVETRPVRSEPARTWSDEELVRECLQGNRASLGRAGGEVPQPGVLGAGEISHAAGRRRRCFSGRVDGPVRRASAPRSAGASAILADHGCRAQVLPMEAEARASGITGPLPAWNSSIRRARILEWRQEVEREQMLRDAIVRTAPSAAVRWSACSSINSRRFPTKRWRTGWGWRKDLSDLFAGGA